MLFSPCAFYGSLKTQRIQSQDTSRSNLYDPYSSPGLVRCPSRACCACVQPLAHERAERGHTPGQPQSFSCCNDANVAFYRDVLTTHLASGACSLAFSVHVKQGSGICGKFRCPVSGCQKAFQSLKKRAEHLRKHRVNKPAAAPKPNPSA